MFSFSLLFFNGNEQKLFHSCEHVDGRCVDVPFDWSFGHSLHTFTIGHYARYRAEPNLDTQWHHSAVHLNIHKLSHCNLIVHILFDSNRARLARPTSSYRNVSHLTLNIELNEYKIGDCLIKANSICSKK